MNTRVNCLHQTQTNAGLYGNPMSELQPRNAARDKMMLQTGINLLAPPPQREITRFRRVASLTKLLGHGWGWTNCEHRSETINEEVIDEEQAQASPE